MVIITGSERKEGMKKTGNTKNNLIRIYLADKKRKRPFNKNFL